MPSDGRLLWFAPIFFGAVVTELLVLWAAGRGAYSWRESLATIGVAIGHHLSSLLRFGVVGVLGAFLWAHRVADVPLHTLWGAALLFVAVEFIYYWHHRLSHTVRWMWASHAVHHSPEELNILASLRLSWTEMLTGDVLFFLPLVWLGIHPAAVIGMLAVNLVYQSWVHTDAIPKLGFLEFVLNTPSNHRVHHAKNELYLDRNYGGVLIVFDRMFGTYVEERSSVPCRYGLVKPIGSANPVRIALHEWAAMIRDVLHSRGPRETLNYLFGRPGLRPRPVGETMPAGLPAET